MLAIYLALKEVWRNRGRFFLFSLVIALITTLVLFVAALAQGLALANKEYLSKLDAQLLIFQDTSELSAASSQIGRSLLNDIRRVEGVAAAGPIGASAGTILFTDGRAPLDISLIGIEVGEPGAPPILAGENLQGSRSNQVVVDANAVMERGIKVGETIVLKTIQNNKEKLYTMEVVGVTDGRQYLYAPSLFLPYRAWDKVRPQAMRNSALVELTANLVAVRLENPADWQNMAVKLHDQVAGVQAVDPKTAIESLPGYSVQQNTLNTQQGFTLLIGILVIGGFFQIQMLQKVPQIGVLKAIGVANVSVAAAIVLQIIVVTTFGVALGGLITGALALAMPATVPVVFSGPTVGLAIAALLLIGPAGGLVSVRLAISVEPLKALGL